MKEKKHSLLTRITALSFVVLIIGSYFNFIYRGFGGIPPIWISWLYQFGLLSVLFSAGAWLVSFLVVSFKRFFN